VRIVVALGGNALGPPEHTEKTRSLVRRNAEELATLVVDGHELIIVHGNGPQVGELILDQEARGPERAEPLPLDVLVAMTQAQIGYLLQQALEDELVARDDHTDVVTLVTEVVVDPDDPEFGAPTKPVGPWYENRPAGEHPYVESGGRWRRVVPSPAPVHLVERRALRAIVEGGIVPICGGGGGVPVIREPQNRLRGVDAVVDKDATSALIARDLEAEALLILTDVDHVERHHGTDEAEPLHRMTVAEADVMLAELPAGSMGPKVRAARDAASEGRLAVIARLGQALAALRGEAGTRIEPR
jgi:carbamate kinase